jgi:hypothetical protein
MVFWQQSLQWFFPQSDPLTALMAAYAIFAISFILRPLGGIFGATLGTSLVEKCTILVDYLNDPSDSMYSTITKLSKYRYFCTDPALSIPDDTRFFSFR